MQVYSDSVGPSIAVFASLFFMTTKNTTALIGSLGAISPKAAKSLQRTRWAKATNSPDNFCSPAQFDF